MRRGQSRPRLRAPGYPLLPPATLGLLLSAIVATNDGRCAAARETEPSTCGRRFIVREVNSNSSNNSSSNNSSSSSSSSSNNNNNSGDGDAATVDGKLSLSRGRGFMGAAMVDDPPLVVFAGGIGVGGKLVDSNVDAFSLPPLLRSEDADNLGRGRNDGDGEALVYRDVLSLAVARTDIGAASTTRALFLAGGCGLDVVPLAPPQSPASGGHADEESEGARDEKHDSGPEIVGEGGNGESRGGGSGRAGDDALDVPLLLKNCQATDAVDVFSLGVGNSAGPKARGEGAKNEGKPTVAALGGLRLSEPKYAATVGVFYTGAPDNGDPSSWAPTAHVLVAGGIVPTSLATGNDEEGAGGDDGGGGSGGGGSVVGDVGGGEGEGLGGQYMATDTVDIFREDGVDAVSGEAKVTTLVGPRLPNPPRFEMTSCCFKHQCVFAGGRVSLGQGGVGFNSDRAEVWDGSTWSFATWGEHTLSEPRHLMGSAAIEISDGSDKRAVGFFVGGVSNNGDSSMVDMFDFGEHRVLPRMTAPTVRGPTQGVSLSREAAAFVGSTGEIDVFDGRTLCWTSYKAEGFLPGASVIGRSSMWFFSDASPGFQPSSSGGAAEEASAFVGGGLGGDVASSGAGVSRDVRELRWSKMEGGDDMKACLGGTPLQQLQKVCGLPGPDGSIQAFTPHDQDRGSGLAGDRETARTIGSPSDGSASGNRGSVVALYIMAALMGIFVSYMASATLIVRKVEGLWRLPFGGGVFEALREGSAQCWRGLCRRCCCCCRCCLRRGQGSDEEAKRPKSFNGKTYANAAAAAGEGTRLIFPQGGGDIEQPRRVRKPNRGGSNGGAGGRSSSLSSRGTTRDSSKGDGEGEVSRSRSRSDSDHGSGGRGYGSGAASDCAGAAPDSSSSAPGVSGQESSGNSNGGEHASFNARGATGGGGGEGRGRRVAAAQEQRRSATATKKRRGGGLQILATSAVDAAAAAARLAEEIANDDKYGAGE